MSNSRSVSASWPTAWLIDLQEVIKSLLTRGVNCARYSPPLHKTVLDMLAMMRCRLLMTIPGVRSRRIAGVREHHRHFARVLLQPGRSRFISDDIMPEYFVSVEVHRCPVLALVVDDRFLYV